MYHHQRRPAVDKFHSISVRPVFLEHYQTHTLKQRQIKMEMKHLLYAKLCSQIILCTCGFNTERRVLKNLYVASRNVEPPHLNTSTISFIILLINTIILQCFLIRNIY